MKIMRFTEQQRHFLMSRGVTAEDIDEFEVLMSTPLEVLVSKCKIPPVFDMPLDEFFAEMKRLGWDENDAKDQVKLAISEYVDTQDIGMFPLPLREYIEPPTPVERY